MYGKEDEDYVSQDTGYGWRNIGSKLFNRLNFPVSVSNIRHENIRPPMSFVLSHAHCIPPVC